MVLFVEVIVERLTEDHRSVDEDHEGHGREDGGGGKGDIVAAAGIPGVEGEEGGAHAVPVAGWPRRKRRRRRGGKDRLVVQLD